MLPGGSRNSSSRALRFVILLGLVSLFADVTYEGARGITGPFLALLGASGAVVGFVAGFGELAGYALRLLSGYLSDRTQQYWALMLGGYGMNLMSVPLLALAGRWEVAALLILGERMGKGIRTPARDVLLSHATKQMGRGLGFGFHEAMDQMGAILGPLLIAGVLYFKGSYRTGFLILLVPALLALVLVWVTWRLFPSPRDLEFTTPSPPPPPSITPFPRKFWLYLLTVALIAGGFAHFSLISYYFEKREVVPDLWIPVFFALAMGVDALSALLFGRLYDRFGISILTVPTFLSSLSAPFALSGNFYGALAGVALWGVGMGAQESIMRAAIADMVPGEKRGTAYGLFNAIYGLFWFLGSAIMGVLLDFSPLYVILFSLAFQLSAIPILFQIRGK